MKNFKVTAKEDNKEYWISRSVAVIAYIFYHDIINNKLFVLADKRGQGTPDFQGYWNCPCGYLDFDETLSEAASREVFEETGYVIDPNYLQMIGISDNPKKSNMQNVSVKFVYKTTKMPIKNNIHDGGEADEVADVKWIDIDNLNKFSWAFDHDADIRDILSTINLNI